MVCFIGYFLFIHFFFSLCSFFSFDKTRVTQRMKLTDFFVRKTIRINSKHLLWGNGRCCFFQAPIRFDLRAWVLLRASSLDQQVCDFCIATTAAVAVAIAIIHFDLLSSYMDWTHYAVLLMWTRYGLIKYWIFRNRWFLQAFV